MCYIGPNTPLEAKKDIKVFKVCYLLDKKIISPIQRFVYDVDSEYYSKIIGQELKGNIIEISQGLHSYLEEEVSIYRSNCSYCTCNKEDMIKAKKRALPLPFIHAYFSMGNRRVQTIVLHCLIPAGSIYYKNKSGTCVSDALKTLDYELVM